MKHTFMNVILLIKQQQQNLSKDPELYKRTQTRTLKIHVYVLSTFLGVTCAYFKGALFTTQLKHVCNTKLKICIISAYLLDRLHCILFLF